MYTIYSGMRCNKMRYVEIMLKYLYMCDMVVNGSDI